MCVHGCCSGGAAVIRPEISGHAQCGLSLQISSRLFDPSNSLLFLTWVSLQIFSHLHQIKLKRRNSKRRKEEDDEEEEEERQVIFLP